MIWRIEELRGDHVVTEFSSGKDRLDRWLRNTAWYAHTHGDGRTRVLTSDNEPQRVRGYHTLTNVEVVPTGLPAKIRNGRTGALSSVLLARLGGG